MQYFCPKCGKFMQTMFTTSIPVYEYYKCFHCGYKSKLIREQSLYTILPKELRSDGDEENEV